MGIDDESSHPRLCSGVADGVTRNIVSLFREPDAGNLPVRFDEREQETEPSQTGLRWRGESQAQYPPGDYSYCACSRLYSHSTHHPRIGWSVGGRPANRNLGPPDCCSVSENWRLVGAVRKVESNCYNNLKSGGQECPPHTNLADGHLREQHFSLRRKPQRPFPPHPYPDRCWG